MAAWFADTRDCRSASKKPRSALASLCRAGRRLSSIPCREHVQRRPRCRAGLCGCCELVSKGGGPGQRRGSILGGMYAKGLGVPQDYAAAMSWLRKAALAKSIRSAVLTHPDGHHRFTHARCGRRNGVCAPRSCSLPPRVAAPGLCERASYKRTFTVRCVLYQAVSARRHRDVD